MSEIKVEDAGKNNQIVGAPAPDSNLVIRFRGDDNRVEFGDNVRIERGVLNFRNSNQSVVLKGDNRLTLEAHLSAPGCRLAIGARTASNGALWMNLGEANDAIEIGEDCLFSNVRFRTSDSHPIYDLASGERINPSASIVLADRVWVAEDVLILKGAHVGAGSAIGARSLVVGKIGENCLAAGVPARVVREGVRWAEKFERSVPATARPRKA